MAGSVTDPRTGVGPALRRARELRGVTLEEAARDTKLRVELLDALLIDDDPERVDDDEYVDTIYSEVEWRLKQGMDRLGRRRSFPIFG